MASISKSWEPELNELEQELLTQDQSDRNHAEEAANQALISAKNYSDSVSSQQVNYKSSSNTESNASEMQAAWGRGVFCKHLNTSNSSGYPLTYGTSLVSLSSDGYAMEICYDRLNESRVFYRGASGSNWYGWYEIWHSGSLKRTEDKTAGAVGTYVLANGANGNNEWFGDTAAGSNLRPSSATGVYYDGTLSGTWRCMGRCVTSDAGGSTTLWLRIS